MIKIPSHLNLATMSLRGYSPLKTFSLVIVDDFELECICAICTTYNTSIEASPLTIYCSRCGRKLWAQRL